MKINFTLNNEAVTAECPPTTRVSTLLREDFNIRSLKNGCNRGQCGCCSVLKNKRIVPSCLIPAFTIKGSEIVTIEGLKSYEEYHLINGLIKKANTEMCDYCKGARILSIYAFEENQRSVQILSDEVILEAFSGIRCNCIDMWTFRDLVISYLTLKKGKKNAPKR